MTTIVGVDPSSKALAFTITTNDRQPQLIRRPLPDMGSFAKRCALADRLITRVLRNLDPDMTHVFIENPFVSPKMIRAVLPLARIQGSLLSAAERHGCATVEGVDVGRWKKVIVKNGSASKQQVAEWVKQAWPHVFDMAAGDQDLLDSACINRYGSDVIKRAKQIAQDNN